MIEGYSRSPEDLVEAIGKKNKDKKEKDNEDVKKVLQVGIYLPCVSNMYLLKIIRMLMKFKSFYKCVVNDLS